MKNITLAFLCLAILVGCSTNEKENQQVASVDVSLSSASWQEQYDLGVRYLSEGNYQEAILAFSAVIEIDPKQTPAFIGRGDAYTALALAAESREEACQFYQKAVSDYSEAANLGDSEARDKIKEIEPLIEEIEAAQKAESLLAKLFVLFEAGDIEGAKVQMRQEEYRTLSEAQTDGFFMIGDSNGYGLAVYKNQYYYYGQWSNGVRSGHGIWLRSAYNEGSDMDSYMYEGEWAEDRPNGIGYIVRQRNANIVAVSEGQTTSIKTEVSGMFLNGVYHGTISEVWYMNDGSIHIWEPITALEGVYQVVEVRHMYNGEERGVVAYDKNNPHSTLSDSGYVHKVSGF